jgi:hypothetical protein
MNKPSLYCLPVLFVKEIASQFLVVLLLSQDMINDHEQGMPDGYRGFLPTSPENEALLLSSQVGLFAVSGGMRRFHQSGS